MRRKEINITKRKLQKLMIIQKTIERKLTVREAVQALDLSQQGGKEQSESFVIHKRGFISESSF
jgi:short-subunit dehydrogenase